MLAKAWIAILLGLLMGSLFFSGGCGWMGGGGSNNPYYNGPCNCGAPHNSGVPAVGGLPTSSGTPGWRAPAASTPAAGGGGGAAMP